MTRQELRKAGYTVTAKHTGAEYPNHAIHIGLGWQFVLKAPGGREREFSSHQSAWAFAERLARKTA